ETRAREEARRREEERRRRTEQAREAQQKRTQTRHSAESQSDDLSCAYTPIDRHGAATTEGVFGLLTSAWRSARKRALYNSLPALFVGFFSSLSMVFERNLFPGIGAGTLHDYLER